MEIFTATEIHHGFDRLSIGLVRIAGSVIAIDVI